MESLKIIRVQPKDGLVITEFMNGEESMGVVRFPQAMWGRFKRALERGAAPAIEGTEPILLVKVVGVPAIGAMVMPSSLPADDLLSILPDE